MKIGIFGGTFNPIHNGHVHLAVSCRDMLGLDKLILIPTNRPPHKDTDQLADAVHRLNMCKIATEHFGNFYVSDLEIKRGGPSYTVDTLRQLSEIYKNDELYFLMGSDMFVTIESWREPNEIYKLATLVAVARGHEDYEDLKAFANKIKPNGARCKVLKVRPMPMSSTRVRSAILSGARAGREVIPSRVYDYIWQNGLYGLEKNKYPFDTVKYHAAVKKMLSAYRYEHSISVAKEAVRLAKMYEQSPETAYVAGLLHDITKEMPQEEQLALIEESGAVLSEAELALPEIWHGYSAMLYIKKELAIQNTDILNAVHYHTTARKNMSMLEKIIYVADLTEENRKYEDVATMRALADQCLDKALEHALKFIKGKLEDTGKPLTKNTADACAQYITH